MTIPRSKSKDANWRIDGKVTADGAMQLDENRDLAIIHAVLMDIRDELKDLNRVMQCPNVTAGFRALTTINKRMGKFDALKLRKPR